MREPKIIQTIQMPLVMAEQLDDIAHKEKKKKSELVREFISAGIKSREGK